MKAVTPETLKPVVWKQANVVTTELLAKLYGTVSHNLVKNFRENLDRFEEGKHYHKLVGEDLARLRTTFSDLQISSKTRHLILWTERGAARHAKMLETDQAWDVFEKLEDCYFRPKDDRALRSTLKDRIPLHYAAVGIMATFGLPQGRSYQMMNLFACVKRLAQMTKGQVSETAIFTERLLQGMATQLDFERIDANRVALHGESAQLDLIAMTIPLVHGKEA